MAIFGVTRAAVHAGMCFGSSARRHSPEPTALTTAASACVLLNGSQRQSTKVANLHWTSDIFDLLLRMHEEQPPSLPSL